MILYKFLRRVYCLIDTFHGLFDNSGRYTLYSLSDCLCLSGDAFGGPASGCCATRG